MNRSIRRVALLLGLAFAALFTQLNLVQVARSTSLANHERNRRLLVAEYSVERGQILAGQQVIAESRPSDGRIKYERSYPEKSLYGHITGYYSVIHSSIEGLEETFNAYLNGSQPPSTSDFVDELLGRERKGHTIVLTIDHALQRRARQLLRNQRGAIAAINPETGAVLALYANPSYDPNPIASHDSATARQAYERLVTDKDRPLRSLAFQERNAPGSTFKIVTAAAGLELGKMTLNTSFSNPRVLDLPDTDKGLRNFGGGRCGGGSSISLRSAFRVSCNTTFAQIGLRVGDEKLAEMASRFGLDQDPDFDLPMVRSCLRAIPGGGCDEPELNRPSTAYSAIGQYDVRVTPLQMAVVGAAVANGGYRVRPYLVKEVQDFAGLTLEEFDPQREGPIFSKRTARALREMMLDVVRSGTGTRARVSGVQVGGKTGTAQTGVEGENPHVWFVGWAKGISVAVFVEHGGSAGSEATGGRVAGPIAGEMIKAAVARRR